MAAEMQKKALDAVKAGDLATLEALVHAGGGNILNEVEPPLLFAAASKGHEHIIRWLLSDDGGRALGFTEVLATAIFGFSALHDAANSGYLVCCKAIVEGCKVENGEREQMLNAVTVFGETILHLASKNGHQDVVRWLLSDGGGRALGFTKVLGGDRNGLTALHRASFNGHLACCEAIVEGCKVENGEREQMLNAMTDYGMGVVHFAVKNPHDNIIRWLLSNEEGGGRALGLKSESVTALNNDSKSALHEAIALGSTTNIETLLSGCTAGERIKLFLAVDKHGWTLLHGAAQWGKAEAIVNLLRWEEAKMIVNHRDHRGMTALHRLACNGGLDEASRLEWEVRTPFWQPPPIEDVVRALLGLDRAATRAKTAPVAFVDVNAGLEIPEEIKIAAAAEEAKKRAASEIKGINVK